MKQSNDVSRSPLRQRRVLPSIMMLAGCLAGAVVWAAPPESDGTEHLWLDEQHSVRELMQLEMRQALLHERRRWQTSTPAGGFEPDSNPAVLKPELTAIYGVGRQLTAEVRWGTEVFYFRQGQSHQPERSRPAGTYVLQAFSLPCVALMHDGQSQRLCLRDNAAARPSSGGGSR